MIKKGKDRQMPPSKFFEILENYVGPVNNRRAWLVLYDKLIERDIGVHEYLTWAKFYHNNKVASAQATSSDLWLDAYAFVKRERELSAYDRILRKVKQVKYHMECDLTLEEVISSRELRGFPGLQYLLAQSVMDVGLTKRYHDSTVRQLQQQPERIEIYEEIFGEGKLPHVDY
jgi:hypothetical protein